MPETYLGRPMPTPQPPSNERFDVRKPNPKARKQAQAVRNHFQDS